MLRRRALRTVTILLTVVGTAGALLAGPASAAPRSGAAHAVTKTRVVRVRPVDATGHLRAGYTITHRHGGASCQLGSEATGTAYRCFAGNEILDPCWVQAGKNRSHVICLLLPWSHQVSRLHVTKGYDNQGPASPAHRPWGLRLTNGTRCAGVQGASGTVHGRPITFFCLHSRLMLLGEANRSRPLWRIHTARSTHHGLDKPSGRRAIATAYFGLPSLKG
jgi:hypothetical protein